MAETSVFGAVAHEMIVVPCMLGISLPVHIVYALVLGLDNTSEMCGPLLFVLMILLPNLDEILTDTRTKNTMVRTAVNLAFFVCLLWVELWAVEIMSLRGKAFSRLELSVYQFGRSILYMTCGVRIFLLLLLTLFHPKREFIPILVTLELGLAAFYGCWMFFTCALLISLSFAL